MNNDVINSTGNFITQFFYYVGSSIENNFFMGVFSLLLTIGLIGLLAYMGVTSYIKIIRAKKEPKTSFIDKETFMSYAFQIFEDASKLYMKGKVLAEKHSKIKNYYIVKDQMDYIETRLEELKTSTKLGCKKKIMENTPLQSEDARLSINYISFEKSLKDTIREVTSMFRIIVKDNHLNDKSEKEFFNYVQAKIEKIEEISIIFFESNYTILEDFPVKDFVIFYNEKKYRDFIEELLISIRDISKKHHDTISTEENEQTIKWNQFTSSVWKYVNKEPKEDKV